MLRLAICDDDKLCREQVLVYVNEYIDQCKWNLTVSVYDNAADLLEEARRSGGWDIYILDILMPDFNGIQLGVELRRIAPDCKILFLTSCAFIHAPHDFHPLYNRFFLQCTEN